LGFSPGNLALYEQAFRHNSYANARFSPQQGVMSNERLEFLGDAVLGSVVAEMLFMTYPAKGEGFLTETRSKIVSREKLAELAVKMGLDELVQFGKGISHNKLALKSLAGNALEALIGAVYLDKGYNFTRRFVHRKILRHHIDIYELARVEVNFKSRLLEWSQKNKREVTFTVYNEMMRGSFRSYQVSVSIDGEIFGKGEDFSKKKAEQLAAKEACEVLKILNYEEN
jgi:ribonuclease-3